MTDEANSSREAFPVDASSLKVAASKMTADQALAELSEGASQEEVEKLQRFRDGDRTAAPVAAGDPRKAFLLSVLVARAQEEDSAREPRPDRFGFQLVIRSSRDPIPGVLVLKHESAPEGHSIILNEGQADPQRALVAAAYALAKLIRSREGRVVYRVRGFKKEPELSDSKLEWAWLHLDAAKSNGRKRIPGLGQGFSTKVESDTRLFTSGAHGSPILIDGEIVTGG